jgi:hypothetical protein
MVMYLYGSMNDDDDDDDDDNTNNAHLWALVLAVLNCVVL